ncbi:calcium-binding protein [Falsiroseomonas sp. HW251]|uniref:calcium-binding protein n=1 Tax=Falsiroseomonas sp. HW251 TaxID=3390998 RepID=UPI003D319926
MQTYGGNDVVWAAQGNTTAYLGDGNDYFTAANLGSLISNPGDMSVGSSIVYAGAGNDTMDIYDATAVLHGGAGNDTYILGGEDHAVTIIEDDNAQGGGIDTVLIAMNSNASHTMSAFVENLAVTKIFTSALVGVNWDDTNGTYEGAAGAGNGAYIAGNTLSNRIELSDRNDTVWAGDGNDTVIAWSGDDKVYGQNGNDNLDGAGGADTVSGAAGNDVVKGGSGNDLVYGGNDRDTVRGDDGNDTLHGDAGNDLVQGGAGHDRLFGEIGNDTRQGDYGSDTLQGGAGDDTYVLVDNDTIVEGAGAGIDTARVAMTSYTIGANVENLTFTTGAAGRFGVGNELANGITGLAGNDTLKGMDGNDVLTGAGGNDSLHAGSGNDWVYAGTGNDYVQGAAGNDFLYGNDKVYGNDGNDVVVGDAGNDEVQGGTGNDTVSGGTGDDTVYGNDGNDMIYGSAGWDHLWGGAGVDYFSYTSIADSNAFGMDVIKDFEKGVDRINLSPMDANSTVAGNQAFGFTGTGAMFGSAGDVWIKEDTEGSLTGTAIYGDLNADFVIFVEGLTGLTASDFIL